MAAQNACPKCGSVLPNNAPAGICPKCLMKAGFESPCDSSQHDGKIVNETTPQPGAFVPPEAFAIGKHFPQLDILELLGHGGMGAVYKARQKKLDRFVALKIIRPESADDPAFAERFNREARTLARLSHPSIVGVHDFGEVEIESETGGPTRTLYYFLMEYVDGASLRQLISAGELKAEAALAIVPQICAALQYAHDEGIVHRDIKPENILVDAKGRVKIADFGLARLVASSPGDFTLTGTHQVMGTPRYMAPEQMERAHAVDHRADIYSLGVVFYEMLTGEVPMGHFDPPSKKAAIDGRLDQVVMRALAREPERRFQHADELKSSVEAISTPNGRMTGVYGRPSQSSLDKGSVSMIFEREMQGAWRWIAGDSSAPAEQPPRLPGLTMFVMSLAGVLMILLPWADVRIENVRTVSGEAVALASPIADTLIGTEHFPGIVAAAAFAAQACLVVATPTRRSVTIRRAVLMTGVAATALAFTLMFRLDLEASFAHRVDARLQEELMARGSNPSQPALDEPAPAPSVASSVRRYLDSVNPQRIDMSVVYRSGFYASLGLSIALLVLSALGVRHALSHDDSTRAASVEGIDPPLTTVRITVPAGGDMGSRIIFHFVGLGYRLVEERNNSWIFERGRKLAWMWAFDLRSYYTRLTIHATPSDGEQMLLNCAWVVTNFGAIITQSDVRKLEDEAYALRSLLGTPTEPELQFSTAGGRDWVTLTREQVENDRLPDVCIVCGKPAALRINKTFEHTPDWIVPFIILGFMAALLPGILIAAWGSKTMRVACPVCPRHKSYWSRLVWIASTGWLLIPVFAGLGISVAFASTRAGESPLLLVSGIIGGLIGLALYLTPVIYLSIGRIGIESMTASEIRLKGVASEFARRASALARPGAARTEPASNKACNILG